MHQLSYEGILGIFQELNVPVSPEQLAGPMANRWVSWHGEHRKGVGVWKMFRETTAS